MNERQEVNTDRTESWREVSVADVNTASSLPRHAAASDKPISTPVEAQVNERHGANEHTKPRTSESASNVDHRTTPRRSFSTRQHQQQHGMPQYDYMLVPPDEALDRMSSRTGLSGPKKLKSRRDDMFYLVQPNSHTVINDFMASQKAIRDQMVCIEGLLRDLVARRQEDALVVHTPRQILRLRKRVTKVRTVPRRTILSCMENLDRDLSNDEFHALLQDLQQPSEVEEEYSAYEYDEEDVWSIRDEDVKPIRRTNDDDVNAFLSESSVPKSWTFAVEDEYDSDLYYDDYYDIEPFDDELAFEEESHRVAVLSDQEIHHSDQEPTLESAVLNAKQKVGERVDYDAKETMHNDAFHNIADNQRRTATSQSLATEERFVDVSRLGIPWPPPPPFPPPPIKSESSLKNQPTSQRSWASRASKSPARTSRVWQSTEGLFRPPPPPPQAPPIDGHQHLGGANQDMDSDETMSDVSEPLDEDELRLLEETVVSDFEGQRFQIDGSNDDEDSIDENDFRILQLSRWSPLSGRKRPSLEEDLLDEDVYSEEAIDEEVTTDDFTDVESAPPSSMTSLVGAEVSSSEEEEEESMALGESAVNEIPAMAESHYGGPHLNLETLRPVYGSGQLGVLPPPPQLPPPPPRPPVPFDAPQIHVGLQQPPGHDIQPPNQPHLVRVTRYASTQYQIYTREPPQQYQPQYRVATPDPPGSTPSAAGRTGPSSHMFREHPNPRQD